MKFLLPVSLFLAFAAIGCDSGPRLVRLHGEVTFGDQPIEKGTIEFLPVDGTGGPSTGGPIEKGRYDVPAKAGPRAGGTYKVQITAMKKTGQTAPNIFQPGGPPLELEDNYIPAKYNRESTLKATITPETSRSGIDFKLEP